MSELRDAIQAALYESDLVDLTFAGDLADVLTPAIAAKHGPRRCVSVEDVNHVLSEAREFIVVLATKLQAVEECYQDGRSQGYVLDSTLRRALDAEAHS